MNTHGTGRIRTATVVLLGASIIGALVVGAVTIAAVSDSETMSYFSGGKNLTATVGNLRRMEAESVRNGLEKWKAHAVMVAAVEAPYLRPPVVWGESPTWKTSKSKGMPLLTISTPTWRAEYKVLKQDAQTSTVLLSVKNAPCYTFTLKKPFGNWWYATELSNVSRSGAGPNKQEGTQLVELRPAALMHGLKLVWDPDSKTAEVSGVNIKATMQVGFNRAKINGREFSSSACPTVIKGKLFVAEDVISRIVAETLVKNT